MYHYHKVMFYIQDQSEEDDVKSSVGSIVSTNYLVV